MRLVRDETVARVAVAFALAACTRGAPATPDTDESGGATAARSAPVAAGSPPVVVPAASPFASLAASSGAAAPASIASVTPPPAAPLLLDGGASSCRAVRGPIELPVRAPAVLVARNGSIDVVLDDEGRPRVASFSAGPLPRGASSTPPPREVADGLTPRTPRSPRVACAVAGEIAFCPDPTGAVHRARVTGEDDRIVASSRAGSRVAAATFAGAHAALAYLASRKTTEGWVSEAWLALDDDVPIRLSEDGSGATAVDLAARGASLLALTVDARTALTAMHARSVAFEHPARLGEDAVLFVGAPGDYRTAATLAVSPAGPAWALLPIARDALDFGLATVRVDDPPRVDEPVVWSMYPNGLDPASIGSVAAGGHTWIARVRPEAAAPGAPHVLELGELTVDGVFTARAFVPTAEAPTDVSLTLDGHAALWLAWVDSSGSWLERLNCR